MKHDVLTRYIDLSDDLKKEINMYGCTLDQMREAVEESFNFRFLDAQQMVTSMLSDCQEMLARGNGQLGISGAPEIDFMISEDIRQLLNRAKWILRTYGNKNGSSPSQ